MGLDTKIYCNHSLSIPDKTKEIVDFLVNLWKDRVELIDSIDIDDENLIFEPEHFKVLVSPKLIEFEYSRYQEIRINTNFRYSGYIVIYPKVVQFTPIGIGRNATNMIVEFMDKPFGIYADDPSRFTEQKDNWNSFKYFLNNFTPQIGGTKHLYINDGQFQGVQEIACEGGTIEKMITASKRIVQQCESAEQFINNHSWTRDDGIKNINGDVWFVR